MNYWQWIKEGIKGIRKNDIAKSMIFLLFGVFVTCGSSVYLLNITRNVILFLIVLLVGLFFTATYTIYLQEGKE